MLGYINHRRLLFLLVLFFESHNTLTNTPKHLEDSTNCFWVGEKSHEYRCVILQPPTEKLQIFLSFRSLTGSFNREQQHKNSIKQSSKKYNNKI